MIKKEKTEQADTDSDILDYWLGVFSSRTELGRRLVDRRYPAPSSGSIGIKDDRTTD